MSRWPADYRIELEAYWRSHHEAWRRSELNQREYCEANGLPLKRFANWRAKFTTEPEPPERLLYRRGGGLSHLTKKASQMTNEMGPPRPDPAKTVAGRRSFSEAEKRRIVDEATQPGMSVAQVGRRYGIAPRVLFRRKETFKPAPAEAVPVFAPVQVLDAGPIAETSTAPSTPGIEIELAGGRRVRFERDADPESVRRLVTLLEGGGQ